MSPSIDRDHADRARSSGGATTRFSPRVLARFVAEVLKTFGLSPDDAATSANFLLIADRRGVESHEIARLPYYASRFQRGLVNVSAELTTVRESASTLALDARNGFALALVPRAMAACIAKAEATGICMATVRASNHFGIAGAYARMAADRGLGGIAMTNASPLVVPTFGSVPMLGTNPIAFAVPRSDSGDPPPLVIDLATSTVAWGKIEVARRANSPIPLGWALDEDARPTTDPHAARYLTPLGGERLTGGHKGYALATMVDVLCGPLAGAAWSVRISGARGDDVAAGIGQFFLAWRIDAFRDRGAFFAEIDDMAAQLRATAVAAGSDREVIFPGDPELAAEAENDRLGIPVRAEVLAELRGLAETVGVPFELDDVTADPLAQR